MLVGRAWWTAWGSHVTLPTPATRVGTWFYCLLKFILLRNVDDWQLVLSTSPLTLLALKSIQDCLAQGCFLQGCSKRGPNEKSLKNFFAASCTNRMMLVGPDAAGVGTCCLDVGLEDELAWYNRVSECLLCQFNWVLVWEVHSLSKFCIAGNVDNNTWRSYIIQLSADSDQTWFR